MPQSAAIFEKVEFFIKRSFFPIKNLATDNILSLDLWDTSFILEKIWIIEFPPLDH